MNDFKKIFSNEKVSASAGSGKTFSLTTRFIALACAKNKEEKFDPFSIIALTFTKKAAGEFLSNILRRLAKAAGSDKEANALADATCEALSALSKNRPTRETFLRVLELCAKNIGKLHLSTIDSLFSAIIRQNANSLKIFAPISITDEKDFQARTFALESVSRMMASQTLTPTETSAFAELVKRASFGKEQKRLRNSIISVLESAHSVYLQNRNLSLWGDIARSGIKIAHQKWDENSYAEKLSILENAIGGIKELDSILNFFKNSGYTRLGKVSTMLERVLQKRREGTLRTTTSLPYNKKQIPLPCADIIDDMLEMLFSEHFARLCDATKAIGKIAELYEIEYDKNVRARGNITFSDMPFLLSDPERAMEKELIEYKLDAKFNHWLFDEFQDTSYVQWNVLRNLVEEAILGEEKSFYYVGDVKQSIYAWRGATPKLFNEISDYYNTNAELISKSKPLTVSWRSGKYVIEAVNKIFGNATQLKRVFLEKSAQTFSNEFAPHKSAETLGLKKSLPSFVSLSLYESARKTEEDTANACKHILEILNTTQPLKRGITCAILVSKNDQANQIVDFLKENGYNAAGELSVPIMNDRPIVSIFTAILRRLAHPQNTASDAYCQMAGIEKFTDNFSDEFIKNSIQKIYENGFASFAKEYENFIKENLKINYAIEFKWLADSCVKLDRDNVAALDDAADFIASRKINTSSGDGVIQVMTVHKSKGLAFGMVIMPFKAENRARSSIAKIGETMLISPSGTLAEMDIRLFEQSQKAKETDAFETICKLYVGATRPERALYILAPKINEKYLKVKPEEDIELTQMLLEAFEPEFRDCTTPKAIKAVYKNFIALDASVQLGDENWFEHITKEHSAPAFINLPKLENVKPTTTLEISHPSTQSAPKNDDSEATKEGSRVHKFFEALTSLKTLPNIAEEFSDNENLVKTISQLIQNKDFVKFFDTQGAFEANEFPILLNENGNIISGSIDRVIVRKVGEKFTSAEIVDYKTSTSFAEKYKPQLYTYKRAVSKIFGIAQENISCFIAGYLDAKVRQV